jgi:septum formation protein
MRLILASGSPRRQQLLEASGYPISAICPADIEERRREGEPPAAYTARLAAEKASAQARADAWVLGADTVVHLDSRVLEKPRDAEDARAMIRLLSSRWHSVTTAWCLTSESATLVGQSTSQVRFRGLREAEVRAYVATGEGMDKAGAYGIQGLGAALVAEVNGSYSNVVGLPMEQLSKTLCDIGLIPVSDPR